VAALDLGGHIHSCSGLPTAALGAPRAVGQSRPAIDHGSAVENVRRVRHRRAVPVRSEMCRAPSQPSKACNIGGSSERLGGEGTALGKAALDFDADGGSAFVFCVAKSAFKYRA